MTKHFRPWLASRLQDGTYFGYVISSEGRPIAGVGLMLIDWPPHPRTDSGSAWLRPQRLCRAGVRRQGLASELMRLAEEEFDRPGAQFSILTRPIRVSRSTATGLGHDLRDGKADSELRRRAR